MRPVTVMGKEEKAMCNLTVATKNKAVGTFGKVKGMASQAFNGMLCLATMAMCSVNAFASFTINTGYQVKDVSGLNPEALILGLAFWLCRLVGISMLIFGIYGYVTARKDGEAESMNGAIGKLVSGAVLLMMPTVLQAIGII